MPKYVVADVDRLGQQRIYFRRPGQRKVRMPSDPDSTEFKTAYDSLLAGNPIVSVGTAPRLLPGRRGALGYVYFVRTRSAVKIGYSAKPGTRLTGLKVGMPDPIKCVVLIRGYMADEKALHRRFEAFRRDGEWFTPTSEILRAMAQAATYGRVLAIKNGTDQVQL